MRNLARYALIGIALGVVSFLLWKLALGPLFAEMGRQIDETQAARKKWYTDCARAGGQHVSNYKGHPSHLCFGPDGRLLSTMS